MANLQGAVDEKLQLAFYEEADANHRLDNLNMFIYMMLLVLTILTAWFFKHFRNRYIHETGLALIYGLLIGVLIRKTSAPSNDISPSYDVPVNLSQSDPLLPKRVIIRACPAQSGWSNCSNTMGNSLRYYEYTFNSALEAPQKSDEFNLNAKATFDPEVFFNVILPAIIFNAGYSLKRRHFFINMGGILFYAFFGTAISAVVIGSVIYGFCKLPYFASLQFTFNDAMLFGSIISATDPVSVLAIFSELGVDVDLHALILGESVLNDAVAIVLSGAVVGYARAELSVDTTDTKTAEALAIGSAVGNFFQVFIGAFAIGTAVALLTALITKFTRLRDFPMLESSLFLLMSYSTFLAAEAASFSGIVALLFCGIVQAHYTYYNLSPESRTALRHITELLSFLAENFCFVQIGVTIFTFGKHYWDIYFIIVAFVAIIIGRAANVYPISFILNRIAKRRISFPFQHMMMFAGLRGAMAFALAIRETETQQQRIIFSTTLVLVIVTIIFCGALVTPLLQVLHIRVGVSMPTNESLAAISGDRRRRTVTGLRTPNGDENLTERRKSSSVNSSSKSAIRYDEFTALQANTPSIMLAYESTTTSPSSTIDEMSIAANESDAVTTRSSNTMGQHHWYSAKVIRSWKNVDIKFLKPIFTQCRPLLAETLPKNAVAQWFARVLTTTQQYEQGADDNLMANGGGQNGGPTPSPPHGDNGDSSNINIISDTDDEPIILSTDSPNIAGHSSDISESGNRKPLTSSFLNSNSSIR